MSFIHLPNAALLDSTVSLLVFLFMLTVGMCKILAVIAQTINQPRVVFEIIGGIILGPSVLGFSKVYTEICLSESSKNLINLFGITAVYFFLFLTGVQTDVAKVRKRFKRGISIALFCMITAFLPGVLVSPLLYRIVQKSDDSNMSSVSSFSLLVGSVFAITSHPILTGILKSIGVDTLPSGKLIIAAAVLTDALCWLFVVVAVALSKLNVAGSGSTSLSAVWMVLAVVGYAVAIILVVKPIMHWVVNHFERGGCDTACVSVSGGMFGSRSGSTDQHLFALVIILLLLSGWFVTLLGMIGFLGTFLFGLTIPRRSRLKVQCEQHLQELLHSFFLPMYFLSSGLKTNFRILHPYPDILLILLVTVIASVGKGLGAGAPAYCSGFSFRKSCAIGSFMNTRSLMECFIITIGYQAGILNTRSYTILASMNVLSSICSITLAKKLLPPGIPPELPPAVESQEDVPVAEENKETKLFEPDK